MNTEYQNSTATSLAPVQDLSFGENASTKKVFVRRFDGIDSARWREIIAWCQTHLYHGGHYEPHWSVNYPSFYFTDEREYTLFCLRWS